MQGTPHDFPSLKPGSHVCLPYSQDGENHQAIAAFMHDGLRRGERCAYWGHSRHFDIVLHHLAARGVPAATLRKGRAVVFADTDLAHARGFDTNEQTSALRTAIGATRSEGYAGLRVASDPDQRTRALLNHDQLAEFETSFAGLLDQGPATGLCAFDQRMTDASCMEVALATHEAAIVAGRLCQNPFFKPSGKAPGVGGGAERIAWMVNNILETAESREFLEEESAALIVEGSRLGEREAVYRRHVAALSRAIEARDRLLVTAGRWLSRPLPTLCGHLEEMTKDQRLTPCHDALENCGEHLASMMRLARGLEEISGFLQMQLVLRPEELDIVAVANAAIEEIKDDQTITPIDIRVEGAGRIRGSWDRLRLTRLFYSLIRTARDQGYDTGVQLRLDDLGQFVRIRLEFQLPHVAVLSESGERIRTMPYGPFGESDYERMTIELWSSRELVRMMGGTLGVSTWADARVVFTLDLPKTSPPALVEEDSSAR
jgi:signal transduction histidine kinase